jgi:gamma-glutamyl phosphate reductase
MEYVIYALAGLAIILFGANKWNTIKRKAVEAKLLTKDTEVKDAELRTKQDELHNRAEALLEEHNKALQEAKDADATEFWKKRLK